MAQGYVDHLGFSRVEFFTGPTDSSNLAAMDQRRRELEATGATGFTRRKIGRNTSCPCGSKRKFKKCCLHRAVATI